MALYPATLNIDFYIQADSKEEAEQKLKQLIEREAFQHDTFEFPEIEQAEYNNSSILDIENKEKQTSRYDRDEVLLDMAINIDLIDLNIKFDFDSRELIRAIVSWTDEFNKIHQYTNWEEADYFLTLDAFTEQKIELFISQLNHK